MSEDPLGCLFDDMDSQPPGFSYPGASSLAAGSGLVMTEELRVLALLAPWLKNQQPFLLVSTQY